VIARIKRYKIPPGGTLVELLVTAEPRCSPTAWWIRRTIVWPRGIEYREISLEFEKPSSAAVLTYDLRSADLREDPTVLNSFIDFCRASP